jgi:uncharacterized damage-inducible protein DinB
MTLTDHFRMLARYNRSANERLFSVCAALSDQEYRKARAGSFGSVHALLNHMLLGDRIWMERFEGGGGTTPPLNAILFDDFGRLRSARAEEDKRIEKFFGELRDDFWSRSFRYINNQGREYVEDAPIAAAHFFNHQTHHRGQVHVMLSDAGLRPPSLDLHRIIHP